LLEVLKDENNHKFTNGWLANYAKDIAKRLDPLTYRDYAP